MRKATKKRMATVAQRLAALPIDPSTVDTAFETFRETGELPEHRRLADAVVQRILRPNRVESVQGRRAFMEAVEELSRAVEASMSRPKEPPVRQQLLHEAVYGDGVVRVAARIAAKALVLSGIDLADPNLVEPDMELPDYGSVGLHLLGFPECLAKPPYEEQAHRLFDRFASLRERIDRDDPVWFEDLAAAQGRFLREGELPDDELMREAVLANGEFVGLLAHTCGHGDGALMAAFDRVARTAGADRDAAIASLRELMAGGRLAARVD